ncbi:MAG: prepilin-type N-terminal cleavage/methylation domain-containing protein [Candidatus Omnitrophota bacterium]
MRQEAVKKEYGFTLIETLLSVVIFVVLSLLMAQFFIQAIDVWQSSTYDTELRSAARNAIGLMSNELYCATRTSTVFPSANLTIPDVPNNHNVTFYLPQDIDGNGLVLNATGSTEWDIAHPVQYQYVAADKELLRVANSTSTILCRDVANVEFEDNAINPTLYNDELRVLLTLQRMTPFHRNVTINLRSIIKLRNR